MTIDEPVRDKGPNGLSSIRHVEYVIAGNSADINTKSSVSSLISNDVTRVRDHSDSGIRALSNNGLVLKRDSIDVPPTYSDQ